MADGGNTKLDIQDRISPKIENLINRMERLMNVSSGVDSSIVDMANTFNNQSLRIQQAGDGMATGLDGAHSEIVTKAQDIIEAVERANLTNFGSLGDEMQELATESQDLNKVVDNVNTLNQATQRMNDILANAPSQAGFEPIRFDLGLNVETLSSQLAKMSEWLSRIEKDDIKIDVIPNFQDMSPDMQDLEVNVMPLFNETTPELSNLEIDVIPNFEMPALESQVVEVDVISNFDSDVSTDLEPISLPVDVEEIVMPDLSSLEQPIEIPISFEKVINTGADLNALEVDIIPNFDNVADVGLAPIDLPVMPQLPEIEVDVIPNFETSDISLPAIEAEIIPTLVVPTVDMQVDVTPNFVELETELDDIPVSVIPNFAESMPELEPIELPVIPEVQRIDLDPPEDVYIPLRFDQSALANFEMPQFDSVLLDIAWQPIEQPEVFLTDGVTRFQQEVNSANALLQRTSQSQMELNNLARELKASPEIIRDFNLMQNRIDGISQAIANLEQIDGIVSPSVNNQLETLRSSLLSVQRTQDEVANGLTDMNTEVANRAYNQLNTQVGQIERQIRDNIVAQNQFNQTVDQGTDGMGRLFNVVRNIGVAVGAQKIVSNAINMSDTYANTTARIDLMNDGLQSTQELQDMILASAQRSGMAYQETADMVGKLGLLAGDAFANSAEIVTFAELINKQFSIAGTNAQEAAGATLQLTQALASGVLRGDELNSVMEQAPTIIQSISDYLGVTKGEIRDLASEGMITADIVKNAMFASADEINAKFETMPKTWSRVWTQFQNSATNALQPILQRINDLANSEGVQTFVNNAITAINMLVNITTVAMDAISGLFSFIASQWAWLGPILTAIASILALHYARIILVRGAILLATAATNAWSAAVAIYQAITGNALLLTISLIILVIGAIYAVVGAFNMLTGSAVSGLGVIMGVIYTLGAVVANVGIAIVNIVLGVVHFVVNLFQAGIFAVQLLWYGLQMAVGIVAFAILSTVQMLVNGVGQLFTDVLNYVNERWYYLSMWVGGYLADMLDNVSAFANNAVDAFNRLKYEAETIWYNIAKGAGNMATAIAQGIDGMINSVIGGIEGMLNSVLGGINDMISALDKIPGVNVGPIGTVTLGRSNMAGKVDSFVSGLDAPTLAPASDIDLGGNLRDILADSRPPTDKTWEDIDLTSGLASWLQNNKAPEAPEQWSPEYLDFLNLGDSYNSGYAQGEQWESQLSDLLSELKGGTSSGSDIADMFNNMPEFSEVPGAPDLGGGGGGNPSGGRLDSVGEIEDEIEMDDEMKTLIRDVAKQKWQQNYITMTPQVTTNIESITTEQEYEDLIAKFNDDVLDAIHDGMDGIPT